MFFFFYFFNSNLFYFENIYGIHISKLLCLGFHILASIITSPILYLIIVYEKNCNYRTLINQMVSSLMCNALAYNLIMTPLTLLFTIISPIDSPIVCHFFSHAISDWCNANYQIYFHFPFEKPHRSSRWLLDILD